VAQRLLQMHPNKSEYFVLPCLQALLADSVLRKLLREDADMGCGVLLALLLAIEQSPQLKLGKKLQESVQKVWAVGAGVGVNLSARRCRGVRRLRVFAAAAAAGGGWLRTALRTLAQPQGGAPLLCSPVDAS
jgi:hypothetical protein